MNRLFISRKDTSNAGDLSSCPIHYFPNFAGSDWIDILYLETVDLSKYDQIIVGGGGLLGNDNFIKSIKLLEPYAEKTFFWGTGINSKIDNPKKLTKKDIHILKLNSCLDYKLDMFKKENIGIRDSSKNHKIDFFHVPCSSCLHKIFDKDYEIEREFLLISHPKISSILNPEKKGGKFYADKKRIFTTAMDIEETVTEIKKSKYIISQSYHGIYWSMLSNRQVICINPWTNKFLFFGQPVEYTTKYLIEHHYNFLTGLSTNTFRNTVPIRFDLLPLYPNWLEYCRKQNLIFYNNRVMKHE